ncbi:MAG: hypothetical protein JW841_14070 [Deltaproteobacteria bacterium]|nr:hypothetical protein [Deltaproteobacteria bacterium]
MTRTKYLDNNNLPSSNEYLFSLSIPARKKLTRREAIRRRKAECSVFKQKTKATENLTTIPWGSINYKSNLTNFLAGLQSANDNTLQKFIKQVKTNSAIAKINVNQRIPVTKSPEALANHIASKGNYNTATWENERTFDFIDVVQSHFEEKAFITDFMRALGPELCTKLTHQSVDAIARRTYKQPKKYDKDYPLLTLKTIAQAFAQTPESFQKQSAEIASQKYLLAGLIFAQPVYPTNSLDTARSVFLIECEQIAISDPNNINDNNADLNQNDANKKENKKLTKNDIYLTAMIASKILSSDRKLAEKYFNKWSYEQTTQLFSNDLLRPINLLDTQAIPKSLIPNGSEQLIIMSTTAASNTKMGSDEFKTIIFRESILALKSFNPEKYQRDDLISALEIMFVTNYYSIIDLLHSNESNSLTYDKTKETLAIFLAYAIFNKNSKHDSFIKIFQKIIANTHTQMLNPQNKYKDYFRNEYDNKWYATCLNNILNAFTLGHIFYSTKLAKNKSEREQAIDSMVTILQLVLPKHKLTGALLSSAKKMINNYANSNHKEKTKNIQQLLIEFNDNIKQDVQKFDRCFETDVSTTLKGDPNEQYIGFLNLT